MDSEKAEDIGKIKEILERLEKALLSRIPSVADRSPDTLYEELEMLNVLLELKMKLVVV